MNDFILLSSILYISVYSTHDRPIKKIKIDLLINQGAVYLVLKDKHFYK